MIRPTRTTGGIAALALALAALAIVIESAAAVLAAGSLGIFILWRAGRFARDFRDLAASLRVDRTVDRTILRQGATANVRVRVDLTPPPGMEARVRDVPPAVSIASAPLAEPGETATYTLQTVAPGRTAFGGIILSARDAFFSHDLHIRHFEEPGLRVFPAGSAEGDGIGMGIGESEVDRRAALVGQGIRGFRLYQEGDDPGLIDWKISARHNILYVREMTGLEGGTPLIAVDLPARKGDPETFTRYLTAVSGAVGGAVTSRDGCSLLVIAGPEVVRFIPGTPDIREAFAALSGLAPIEPRAPLYRAPGPALLAARARVPGGGGGPERIYRTRLGQTLTTFARGSRSSFADAVVAALARTEATEVHIYTLAAGDMSHLAQVIHLAKARGMRVVANVPPGTHILPGIDAVEAI